MSEPMTEEAQGRLTRPDGEQIAWRKVSGEGPVILWLGGYRSDMMGGKAQALADWARTEGRGMVRFDYFGHGESSGDFLKGTIGRWRADVLAVIDGLAEGPVMLVGSSMGGWLACLAALARPERVAGLVLIAPAADFTETLVEPLLDDAAKAALEADGVYRQPSVHGEPTPFTRLLLEDGRMWPILRGVVPITAPVRILQGALDDTVPWSHALELYQALAAQDVVFSLIKDGDHRLSRPQDLARLITAVAEIAPRR